MDCLLCRSSHTTTDDESEVHAFLLVNEENSENEELGFENELDIDNMVANSNRECNSNPEYNNGRLVRKKSYSRRNVVKRSDKNVQNKEYDYVEVNDERRRNNMVLFPIRFLFFFIYVRMNTTYV